VLITSEVSPPAKKTLIATTPPQEVPAERVQREEFTAETVNLERLKRLIRQNKLSDREALYYEVIEE